MELSRVVRAIRRPRAFAGVVPLLAALTLLAAVPAAAEAGAAATFSKGSDWGSGFIGHYVIRNDTAATIRGWELEFDLPVGERLTSAWSAKLSSSGTHYLLTDEEWTRSIAPGGSVEIGFQGAYSGQFTAPADCTLNGEPCAGGGSTPADTSAPAAPTNLVASSPTTSSIYLSWAASSDDVGVTEYYVYEGSSRVATTASTSVTVGGLVPGTSYAFTVRAADAAGNLSLPSNAATASTASAATNPLSAAFTKASDWGSGFVGGYDIRNEGPTASSGWTLEFDLPSSETITSAWSAKLSRSGNRYTLTDESWTRTIAPGSSIKVGFQGAYSGSFTAPANCTLNGQPCSGGPGDTNEPPDGEGGGESESGDGESESGEGAGSGATAAAFAPYVDMTLSPFSSIAAMATESGAERLTLAFIVSGAACTASWGGYYGIDDATINQRISALEAAGAEAIVSFGGAINQELARTCTSVASLAAQYQAVIDQYGIRDLDFDIEGADQSDATSLHRRFQAIAQIQAAGLAAGKPVHVSLTLPVLPTGLTHDGLDVVQAAIEDGVDVGAVNVMAMDYFDPALGYAGKMGDYAIQAAAATHDQLAQLYPQRTDAELWGMLGVTPMIGINDDPGEIFTTADAEKLTGFANEKGLGRLAMWSLNRDAPCPAPTQTTSNTCSGVSDPQWAFSSAFAGFGA